MGLFKKKILKPKEETQEETQEEIVPTPNYDALYKWCVENCNDGNIDYEVKISRVEIDKIHDELRKFYGTPLYGAIRLPGYITLSVKPTTTKVINYK